MVAQAVSTAPATSAALEALRQSMVAREDRFPRLARDLEEAGCGLASEKTLERLPRGFECVGSGPLGKYLKLLDPLSGRSLDVSCWRSGSVVDETVEFARTVPPWLLFVREALRSFGETAPERPPRSSGAGLNNSSWG